MLRPAVNRRCAGDDDSFHAFGAHGVEQTYGAADVIAVIRARIAHGFPYLGQRGKVNDAVRPVAAHAAAQPGIIKNVPVFKFAPAGQIAESGGQIVIHHDIMAVPEQMLACMTPDIARSARDQNFHDASPSSCPGGVPFPLSSVSCPLLFRCRQTRGGLTSA